MYIALFYQDIVKQYLHENNFAFKSYPFLALLKVNILRSSENQLECTRIKSYCIVCKHTITDTYKNHNDNI